VSISRLDSATTSATAGHAGSAASGQRRGTTPPSAASTGAGSASPGTVTDRLQALAAAIGVDPDALLAHLTAATTAAADPTGTATAPTEETPAPLAAVLSALRNPEHPSNAWASDLALHRGGLLVDITV